MNYLLLCLSVLFAVSNNLLLHKFGNKGLRGTGDVLLFNAVVSAVWVVILLPISGFEFSKTVVFGGIVYGLITAGMLFCKMQAMTHGPVSLTTFAGCASLLISTVVGVLVWKESIGVLQGIGVILLIASLFLVVSPKSEKTESSWKYWCVGFFLFSGSVGVAQKAFQSVSGGKGTGTMLAVSAFVSAILLTAVSTVFSKIKLDSMPHLPKNAVVYALACGIVSCLYNRINNTLSGKLPSVVFFPGFNGSFILLATLCGVLLFREKLARSQAIGLAVGAVALMLTAGVIKI